MAYAETINFEEERLRRRFRERKGRVVEKLSRRLEELEEEMIRKFREGKRTMMDFVESAREVVKALEPEMTTTLLDSFGPPELKATTTTCGVCGKTLHMKRMAERTVETMSGPVTYRRPYFYCSKCRRGFCPADAALKLAPGTKQFDIQEASSLLTTEVPYEVSSRIFKRLTGRDISPELAHDTANDMGDGLGVLDVSPSAEEVRAQVLRFTEPGAKKPVIQITIDGAMAPTRPDDARGERPGPKKMRANRANWQGKWREVKGFRIALSQGDRFEHILSWHQVMNDETLEAALIRVRDAGLVPEDLARICVAADGAKWIWNVVERVFPRARQVLDYWHMKEHLHDLAKLKYGEGSDRSDAWVENAKGRICAGQVDIVIAGLRRMRDERPAVAKAIEDLITYLDGNRARLDYENLKQEEMPCGSGAIESANKFISNVRLKRSGAWWYAANANRILALRCAAYNGTYDRVCERFRTRVLKRDCPRNAAQHIKRFLEDLP